MNALLLLVTYTAKPGMRDVFLQEVLASGILDKIRAEKGCLRYAYYKSAENPDEILLTEQWAAPEHQPAHMQQPHMKQLLEIKNRLIQSTSLERMTTEGDD